MRPIKCQALNDFIGKRKYIVTESATAKRKGRVLPFETKWTQVATMIKDIHNEYQKPVMVVTGSWFVNYGL